jgi:hypothetical protein
MKKVGYRRVEPQTLALKKPKCINCGALATRRVTFRDDWCTLRVVLCEECAHKEYEDLHLQKSIQFPGVA